MTEEQFVELLQNAVDKVKTEEDPVELNYYRKLFKKNVPFALRNYVAAYLAKNAAGGAGGRDGFRGKRDRDRFNDRRGGRMEREGRGDRDVRESRENREPREIRERTEHEPAPRTVIPEEIASTIFISVGRNRRVFPRDLIGLIVSHTTLDRTRIGDIRVLDNYSFVQLYAEDAENVIAALNGAMFRGRKLNVSYSRKKDEVEDGGLQESAAIGGDIEPEEADGQKAFFPPETAPQKSVYDEIQPATNASSTYLV